MNCEELLSRLGYSERSIALQVPIKNNEKLYINESTFVTSEEMDCLKDNNWLVDSVSNYLDVVINIKYLLLMHKYHHTIINKCTYKQINP